MNQPRERNQPRISVTKLGEYMVASASRRRRIVIDQKRPADCIVARYNDAQNSITENIVANAGDYEFLQNEIERITRTEAQGDWQEQNRQLCIEALRAFGIVFPDLMLSLTDTNLKRGESDPPKLYISGVAVSVRPEVIVTSKSRQGSDAYGAIKLYLSKTNPLTPEAGEFVATTVHKFVTDCLCGDSAAAPEVERRLCFVVDVFNNKIFSPPKAYVRRRHDVTAACEEICRAWDAL